MRCTCAHNISGELASIPPGAPPLLFRSKVTSRAIPLLAKWNIKPQLQDVPQRLLATWLRAEGPTVTAGRQRVSPRLVWWLPVSQTAINAKTPTLRCLNGALQAQTMIRPHPLGWTRPRPPKEPEGGLEMGLRQSRIAL